MAAAIDEPPPLLERAATAVFHGLFGLGLIAREHSGPASSFRANSSTFGGLGFILATVIEAAQMLAFPLSHTQHVWHGTLVGEAMAQALTVVMPGSIDVWFGPVAYRVSCGPAHDPPTMRRTARRSSLGAGQAWAEQVLFTTGIVWVLVFISLSVSIALAFVREKKQSELALRVFRGVAALSTTVLFLPVSALLFRSYSCDAGSDIDGSTDDWLGAGVSCGNVWRMIALGVVALLLFLFFILAMFVASTFIDNHPDSMRWAAKSHGRVAVALLGAKVLLTAIYNISPTAARSVGTGIALITAAVGWLVAIYRELPMLRPVANALRAGSASAFLWASVALLIAILMPAQDLSVLTLVGIPVAAAAGGMIVLNEARRVVNGKLADCTSVSHILLWASARVQEAERIRHKAEGTSVATAISRLANRFGLRFVEQADSSGEAPTDEDGSVAMLSPRPAPTHGGAPLPLARGPPGTVAGAAAPSSQTDSARLSYNRRAASVSQYSESEWSVDSEQAPLVNPVLHFGAPGQTVTATSGSTPRPARHAGGGGAASGGTSPRQALNAATLGGLEAGGLDDETSEAIAQRRLHLLMKAEGAYRMAMKSQSSGIALAAAAVFYQTFSVHTQQEVECIAKLKAMQPAPDLAFVVFVRGIELSDSTAAEGGLAPIDRVMFEQMAEETRGLRATALRSMVELWAHLEQKKPDLWQ
ncbi:unnamed protein product, partial [Symbiodinium sp. KB8]